jgi:predicted RNA-binding protein
MPDVAANEKISATVNESLLIEVNGENRKIVGSQQKMDLSKKIIVLRMTVFLPVCSMRLMRPV